MSRRRPRTDRLRTVRAGPTDRGSASIQMVMLMPVLFTVMFLGLQAALYYWASTVAGAAAQDGAREASAFANGGDLAAGRAAALDALEQSHGSLQDYHAVASGGSRGATVTVTGVSLSVLPGMTFHIKRSATLPWEELT